MVWYPTLLSICCVDDISCTCTFLKCSSDEISECGLGCVALLLFLCTEEMHMYMSHTLHFLCIAIAICTSRSTLPICIYILHKYITSQNAYTLIVGLGFEISNTGHV